ncbi:hypothetical protein PILCRDRAFT_620934 [Piloderma croceum F 1598]|uniref:Uncharacterized protein n=1 Tax=Piloderma croceum (strain F 1598) TaxID=765440 RepID=A0A0C3FC46_PILCF|nr:hypothetical protein PILCRDRAFT_620934 [Piloderma croceum F 1598]
MPFPARSSTVCSVTVPVLPIITNTDARECQILSDLRSLRRRGCPTDPEREAVSDAGAHEKVKLKEDQAPLSKLTHVVYLRDVHELESNYDKLITQTAAAINFENFKLLYVSALRNKSEHCIENIIKM